MKRAVLLFAMFSGCGGGSGAGDARVGSAPGECHVQLIGETPANEPVAPPSRLVTHAVIKMASLKKELETQVPTRLAEQRGVDIGVAGSMNYTVDRGPLSVSIENNAILVRTDVKARAEACAKGRCYAGCDPVARVTATVPLALLPTFRFAPSRVAAQFTERCKVKALFVKVDITPTIEAQIQPSLRRVEQQIDAKLPNMRPQAERLWGEINKERPMPLGGCVVVQPRSIVQGPVTGNSDEARFRFGLLATPEVRRTCGAAPPMLPLPPLAQDPSMRDREDVLVGFVAPKSALDTTRPAPCEDVVTTKGLTWAADLADIRVTGTEAHVSPPAPPLVLKELAPTLAGTLSDPQVDVSATVEDVKPSDVFLRREDLVARVLARGSVEIRQK